jgi:hypothetical protein
MGELVYETMFSQSKETEKDGQKQSGHKNFGELRPIFHFCCGNPFSPK